nr:tyrosine-type recombinase/integrase [Enterobacter asburiae]
MDILHRPASSVPMNSDFAQLLLCCIHTAGQRPWEIMTNTKSNWDKKGKVLTVPPEISKTGDYHVIPLSATATSILEEMEKRYPESDFLFLRKQLKDTYFLPNTESSYENSVNANHLINLRQGIYAAPLKHWPEIWV